MGSRITQNQITTRTLRDLNNQLGRLSLLQTQLATGQRVNRPSDDPMDARRAMSIQTQMAQSIQYNTNISNMLPQLRESESVLSSTIDIFQRALELTIAASNETMGQDQLDQSAVEIDQLLEQIFLLGNTQVSGRSIFAGTRTGLEPFQATRDINNRITAVTYLGNSDPVDIQISNIARINTSIPGDDVFQNTINMFEVLIGIRDDMEAGNQANLSAVRLDEIDQAQKHTSLNMAKIGALQNRLTRVVSTTEDLILSLQEQLSDRIDADFAETMLNFNVEQNAYQAALNASARVLQSSLMDFYL